MPLKKTIIEPSWEAKYSFSPAVVTEGGRTIWLDGHVGFADDTGASLAGNFDAQVRQASKKCFWPALTRRDVHCLSDTLCAILARAT